MTKFLVLPIWMVKLNYHALV